MLNKEWLRKLYQKIVYSNLWDKGEACGSGDSFWCLDYWSREVIRFLIDGKEKYFSESPPDYLRGNTFFSPQVIETAYDFKSNMLKNLEKYKYFSDNIMVCECGWGIDIILALSIKDWKKIICYDQNPYIIPEVRKFFDELKLPAEIEIREEKSHTIDFSKIDEPRILILEHPHMYIKNYKQILNNKNLLFIIEGMMFDDYIEHSNLRYRIENGD